MRKLIARIPGIVVLLAALAGCGGDDNVVQTCDEVQFYQAAQQNPRVRAPDGLDELEQYKEMQIPEATTEQVRPPGSPCIELPP